MSVIKKIPVQLDRERTLVYDYAAILALEEVAGVNLLQGVDLNAVFGSAKGVRDFLWAGLLHEDPDLTREQVTALLSFDRIVEVGAAITTALNEAMPKPRPGSKPANPRKASRPTR